MKLTSYWLDTTDLAADYVATPLPHVADVAVVGAGLTGLSAALHLAKAGAKVVVLEKNTVGWGASGRNGGMATTGLAVSLPKAVKRYGMAPAQAMFRTYNDAIDTVEELVREQDIDCDFSRSGKLTLASKPSHYEALVRTHELLAKEMDYETTLVPRGSIHSEIGSDYYHGALVDPLAAGAHVGKLVAGLARAARKAGVVIQENTEVTRLDRRSQYQHDVVTTGGRVRAEQVLLATSGYTGALVPWLQRRVVPIGSFIIVTEPLSLDVVDELMPTRRMASDTKHLLYYFRITPDNRLLFGGRARFAISNPDSDVKSGQILQRAMESVFPRLKGIKIAYCWGGIVDMTRDQMVHAGERDGVFYSLGYSGHGVQMATHMGKQMAAVLNGETEANIWGDLAFRAIPGHFGPPWFLPFAGAFYKFLDAVQ